MGEDSANFKESVLIEAYSIPAYKLGPWSITGSLIYSSPGSKKYKR